MRLLLNVAVWAAGLSLCTLDRLAAEDLRVKVMTFNIRLSPANDGPDRWEVRKPLVVETIRRFGGDFVGVQEAWADQIAYLAENLPEYRWIGRSREADPKTGEGTPLFYRHDRWELDPNEQGTFWLSDAPDVPGSRSWGNDIPRIVTWGRFTEKASGRALSVINTHFDHRSEPSRRQSAEQLARFVAQRAAREPVVVTGDFNAPEDSYAIRFLRGEMPEPPVRLVDTFRAAHRDAAEVGTFNGFKGDAAGAKIDYVFALPSASVLAAEIVRTQRDGRFPSDHFPVTAELAFPAAAR
jgi:endonuclease/exonuclease/phosphatase family metal-dependent hydrolase